MNIVVCIKQVPDVDDIKWTKENNLDRANMLSKLNPHDEWALDWAMKIKTQFPDVKITAITMGPNQAIDVLNIALAKGADRAILLSDKAFAGADTLVTARILSSAIQKYIPDFNLILTGHLACDGDTAQVPVNIAQMLDIIDVIGVVDIHNADKTCAIVSQKFGNIVKIFEAKTPCLLAIKNMCNEQVVPKIEDYVRAQNKAIETYGLEELGLDKMQVGILGSPTVVAKAYRPEIIKETIEIENNYTDKIIEILLRAK